MFTKEITIKFRDADPIGILFFGNIFGLAHDAFEDFLPSAGFTWREWFQTKDYLVPIRHTEANFLAPFVPGDSYKIHVGVDSLSNTAFKMKYLFKRGDKLHAEVLMVHAFLDAKTHQKIPLPEAIRSRLEKVRFQNS